MMDVIKTTDYFNKSIEELSELRNDGTWTREECLICDDGLKIVFYSTLENLQNDYEEYPIYEPAEGGYYYRGNQLVASERKSKRACKKNLLEIWEECKQDNAERGFGEDNKDEWEQIRRNTHEYPWHFDREHNYIYKGSYYIGEGESYVIERDQGSQEHGWHPYC